MVTGKKGEPEIDRASYELGVLRTVREKLRCKKLWVVGAKRYRNPDDDLPQDFDVKREHYYQELQQPLEVAPFIDQLQAEMTEALTEFNQGLPNNPKVKILNNRNGWIHLTPVTKQPEPEHLEALKQEIAKRWSMLPLLDVLKETEMRLQFTEHFKVQVTVKHFLLMSCANGSCSVFTPQAPTWASSGLPTASME